MARILLIDDDQLLRGILAKALTYSGYEVIQAADGQQGLDLFFATKIDLVITDLIMPGQEGVETILHLLDQSPDTPIIAISGVPNSKVYLEIAEKIGATRILPKPFTPKQLLTVINEVLAPKK